MGMDDTRKLADEATENATGKATEGRDGQDATGTGTDTYGDGADIGTTDDFGDRVEAGAISDSDENEETGGNVENDASGSRT